MEQKIRFYLFTSKVWGLVGLWGYLSTSFQSTARSIGCFTLYSSEYQGGWHGVCLILFRFGRFDRFSVSVSSKALRWAVQILSGRVFVVAVGGLLYGAGVGRISRRRNDIHITAIHCLCTVSSLSYYIY